MVKIQEGEIEIVSFNPLPANFIISILVIEQNIKRRNVKQTSEHTRINY